MSTYLHFK